MTTIARTLDLPAGFDTLDQLAQSMAGAAYIIGRSLTRLHDRPTDYSLAFAAIPAAEIFDDDREHDRSWIARFADDSILIHTNAENAVWADAQDYLDDCGCDSLQSAISALQPAETLADA